MRDLVHTEHPLSEKEFDEFSQMFRRAIPDSFRRHYLHTNGGVPAEEEVESGKCGLPITGFIPIKYGRLPIEMLIKEIGNIVPDDSDIGPWQVYEYVPFASDQGGNSIFLSLLTKDYGKIYVWLQDGGNVFNILPSFDVFLEKLYNTTPH